MAEQIWWKKEHPRMGTEALPWPARKTAQAAGWDCCAAIDGPIKMWPGQLVKVPLGFSLALPEGYEAQIRPRSGLASRGLMMPNSPGTVDADYRGEVSAILYWLPIVLEATSILDTLADPANEGITINPGDRIAQMVICKLPHAQFVETEWLPTTDRGSGGFGSTGVAGRG